MDRNKINHGDLLDHINGYCVRVVWLSEMSAVNPYEDKFVGKLVCAKEHPFANIPYSLENNDGYSVRSDVIDEMMAGFAEEIEPLIYESETDECPYCHSGYFDTIATYGQESNTAVSMMSGPFYAEDWKVLYRCSECSRYYYVRRCNY